MAETINLEDIFKIVKKRMVLILTVMLLGSGLSAIMTFVIMKPNYYSSSQLLAKMSQDENVAVNLGDVNTNLMLINTYKDIIKSDLVLSESATMLSQLGYQVTASELASEISVIQAPNSQMFTISALSADPRLARDTVNVVADVFKKKASEVIDVDKITILAPATLAEKPTSPNNKLNLVIGLVLGLFLGLGLALTREIFDKTVKDETFISEELGITLLGAVPQMTEKELLNEMPITESSIENTRRSRNRA